MVKWGLPSVGSVKCIIDGASEENPGVSSYGFCLRDHKVNLIFSKAQNMEIATNMIVEAKAILETLWYCFSQGLQRVTIQTDSLDMLNFINKVCHVPWKIVEIIEEIKREAKK